MMPICAMHGGKPPIRAVVDTRATKVCAVRRSLSLKSRNAWHATRSAWMQLWRVAAGAELSDMRA
jgi:hypothetical protein